MKGRLGRKLRILLLLSISLSLAVLLYFSLKSFQIRRSLLVQRALESQQERLLQIEQFYLHDLESAFKETIQQTLEDLSLKWRAEKKPVINRNLKHLDFWRSHYIEYTLPKFGLILPEKREDLIQSEQNLPVRKQILSQKIGETRDFFEVLETNLKIYDSAENLMVRFRHAGNTVESFSSQEKIAIDFYQHVERIQIFNRIREALSDSSLTQTHIEDFLKINKSLKWKRSLESALESQDSEKIQGIIQRFLEERKKLLRSLFQFKNHKKKKQLRRFHTLLSRIYGEHNFHKALPAKRKPYQSLKEYRWQELLDMIDPFGLKIHSFLKKVGSHTNDLRDYFSLYNRDKSNHFHMFSKPLHYRNIEDPDWRGQQALLDVIVNGMTLRDATMDPYSWDTIRAIVGIQTSDGRKRFIHYGIGKEEVILYCDHLPVRKSYDAYFYGLEPLQRLLSLWMIKRSRVKDLYLSMLNEVQSNQQVLSIGEIAQRLNLSRSPSTGQFRYDFSRLSSSLSEVYNKMILQFQPGNPQQSLSPFHQLFHFFSLNKRDLNHLSSLQSLWSQQTKGKFLEFKDLDLYLKEFSQQTVEPLDQDSLKLSPKALRLGDTIVFVLYSSFFEQLYVAKIPRDSIEGELDKLSYILLGIVLVSLSVSLLLINKLSLSILSPVNLISRSVENFKNNPSNLPQPTVFTGDELEMVDRLFVKMSHITRERISQLQTMNTLLEEEVHENHFHPVAKIMSDLFDLPSVHILVFDQGSQSRIFLNGNHQFSLNIPSLESLDIEFESGSFQEISLEGERVQILGLKKSFSVQNSESQEDPWYALVLLQNPPGDWFTNENQSMFYAFADQWITLAHRLHLNQFHEESIEGREVQNQLLPQLLPQLERVDLCAHFEAARFLGGDFYDCRIRGEELEMVISDVSGKGIGPSLFGMTCKSYLELLGEGDSLVEILQALNNQLCEEDRQSLFATMFICRLDLKTHKLRYSSAGHNRMILQRANKEIEYLSTEGIPLAFLPGQEFEEMETQLHPGDLLFLYTDGLVELENPQLELFGYPRIEETLAMEYSSCQELQENFLQKCESFRKDRLPSDDLTMLFLRV